MRSIFKIILIVFIYSAFIFAFKAVRYLITGQSEGITTLAILYGIMLATLVICAFEDFK